MQASPFRRALLTTCQLGQYEQTWSIYPWAVAVAFGKRLSYNLLDLSLIRAKRFINKVASIEFLPALPYRSFPFRALS